MRKILLRSVFLLGCALAATGQILTLHFIEGDIDILQLSEIERFYFVDSNATVIRLQSPFNGEMQVGQTPNFRWQYIPGKQYELMLADNAEFTDTLLHISNIDTNNYRPATPLNVQTRYYWKVRVMPAEAWSAPWYFTTYMPVLPQKIQSFAIIQGEETGSLKLKVISDSQIDSFLVVYGFDGISFPDTAYCDTINRILNNLEQDSCYFMKIAGINGAGTGPVSEVLAASVSEQPASVLIINGFDRATIGNSYDFIRQHAQAVRKNGYSLASASNEAVYNSLVQLQDYQSVIYILGEESTADETFSNAGQDSIEAYLQNGGRLFVSGAEIAWDLDYKGNASDKTFCKEYLHMQYVQDSPNNAVGVHYHVDVIGDTIFSDMTSFYFDNGTHGSYNVNYPDVIKAYDEGRAFLTYTGCSTGAAGIVFEGVFPGGMQTGKIMVLGFPFETIYPEEQRTALMGEFFQFVEQGLDVKENDLVPQQHILHQNYPNPFNPRTTVGYTLANAAMIEITIIDVSGRTVQTLVQKQQTRGSYEIHWNAKDYSTGIYVCVLKVDQQMIDTRKMVLMK